PQAVEGRQGAARYSWFDYPEPVTIADTNFNRGVDRQEWITAADERFDILDRDRRGAIRRDALPPLPTVRNAGGRGRRPDSGGPGRPVDNDPGGNGAH
nr:hypothetical protein [Pseudomonadota bacterium]